MPMSAYRDFQLWALSDKNLYLKFWMQVVGLPQFAKLTETLLRGKVKDEQWDELIPYTTYMNAYLIYETVSDNLAFGLAERKSDDMTYDLRREVLIGFNYAMIAALKGNIAESDAIMSRIKDTTELLSGFKHSLTASEQQTIAQAFLAQHPQYTMDDIEFGTWNALVANINACVEIVGRFAHFQLGDYLRQGLISRYEAVNDLLCGNVTDQDALLRVNTNTILVIPVLTYYISVLAEILDPNPGLGELMENGVLYQALEDAALMVRLLNDMGTNLVATEQFPMHLLNELYTALIRPNIQVSTLTDLLTNYSAKSELMTRIRKDLSFGEFNVSLHNLTNAPASRLSLLLFGNNLVYFQGVYRQCEERLRQNLQIINETFGTDTIGTLIYGFVRFHEYIYQNQFDSQSGDYATKPNLGAVAS